MIRKIILLIVTVIVGIFLYFGYQKIKLSQEPKVDVYSLVPVNAVAIIEISDPFNQWDNLLSNNIIWDELKVFEPIQNLEAQIIQFDSAFHQLQSNSIFPSKFSIIISFVENENKELNTLFHTKLNSRSTDKFLHSTLKQLFKAKKISVIEAGIIKIESADFNTFALVNNHILSLCSSKQELSNILSQHQKKHSLTNNPNFNIVRKTSSKNSMIKLFINPIKLSQTFSSIVNSNTKTQIDLLPSIGEWAELDVDVMPDEISMGGFISTSDSITQWISLFNGQEAIKHRVVQFIPNRTAFIMHLGFSDFELFRQKLVSWKSTQMGSNFDQSIKTWDTMYDVSIDKYFLQWVDDEIALVIGEPEQKKFKNDAMLWISSTDAQNMSANLQELALKVSNKNQTDFYRITYLGYDIFKLDIPDFLSSITGNQFGLIEENYFVKINDYIVFSNSPAILQWSINKLINGQTLNKDPDFISFENRISAESNVFIYSHIAGSPNIYQSLANNKLQTTIGEYREWLQKFQVTSLQISHENNNLYYVNNYWKYNPVYKKESNSLWEVQLDHPVSSKPTLVTNHYTNASEIFIQDTGNVIYLISNKGKILWKRDIEEPIISPIKQVDVYRNNKLQLIFNTKNHIYIIDRNGRDLQNYPIKLPFVATAPMAIFDYENNKNYRLIIPIANGDILNYKIKGILTTGWKYKPTGSIINQQVKYISIKQKDYLIVVFENGAVKALDRKGLVRINLKSKFGFKPFSQTLVHQSSELSTSYILSVTENKEVVKITMTDEKIRMFDITVNQLLFTKFADVDGDGAVEIIAIDSQEIKIFKSDGKFVSSITTTSPLRYNINTYKFDNQIFIGYNSVIDHQIYLTDLEGNLVAGFPMNGTSPFTISDINQDKRLNVITTNKKGIMVVYTMD